MPTNLKAKPSSLPASITTKIHGIFNTEEMKLVKVSLDETEIQMDMLLSGDRENLSECVMNVTLTL